MLVRIKTLGATLWLAGFALAVLTGGQPEECPWALADVAVDPRGVTFELAEPEGHAFCGGAWQPRALAVTVPADELAEDAAVTVVHPRGEREGTTVAVTRSSTPPAPTESSW